MNWDALYEIAEPQQGLFTAEQAQRVGYYRQRLAKHLRARRVERVTRGIYRLRHFPRAEDEQLVALWLWSRKQGVFSHATALERHALSDVSPRTIELTVPTAERGRRRRLPAALTLHYADLGPEDIVSVDGLPFTRPARAVNEFAAAHGDPDQVAQAIADGLTSGLFVDSDVADAMAYLRAWRLDIA